MQIKRIKPYKACNPLTTITNIRNILNGCGIFLMEKHHISASSKLYSSRLTISGHYLEELDKGTNGKGLSPEYSLASAYGEFMERLQNYYIFNESFEFALKNNLKKEKDDEYLFKELKNNNIALDFLSDPDEIILSSKDFTEEQIHNFEKLFPYKDKEQIKSIFNSNNETNYLLVPFYDVRRKKAVNLPIQLLQSNSGSNGMCAGNTKKEALIQGICEIFERHALKSIFEQELTPPTIPRELFKSSKIYELLNSIEKESNLKFVIKDCSLGIGLPVIGLLILDHSANSYAFNLGSDPSPITALERCISEIYQGDKFHDQLKKLDITKDPFYDDSNVNRSIRINEEFLQFCLNGNGRFPNSIFSVEDSYPFNDFYNALSKNDDEDLSFLVKKIMNLGCEFFIRDVSFLDFPAFYIFIPGMSDVRVPFKNILKRNSTSSSKKKEINLPRLLSNLNNLSDVEYQAIVKVLENINDKFIKLFPYNVDAKIERVYLLALISYRIKNYKKAFSYLNECISKFNANEISENLYLICAKDFIFLKDQGRSETEIKLVLNNLYNDDLVNEVIEDLKDESNVFDYQDFPRCFNCDQCSIKECCRIIEVLKLIKKIQQKHKENKIQQDKLIEIFE